MKVRALDDIVLCVSDVTATRRFYERVLNMESRERAAWQMVAAFRHQ
jgi:hypothetical protein